MTVEKHSFFTHWNTKLKYSDFKLSSFHWGQTLNFYFLFHHEILKFLLANGQVLSVEKIHSKSHNPKRKNWRFCKLKICPRHANDKRKLTFWPPYEWCYCSLKNGLNLFNMSRKKSQLVILLNRKAAWQRHPELFSSASQHSPLDFSAHKLKSLNYHELSKQMLLILN